MPVPELRPFRGLRYDAARVADMAAVLCPPYDVISSGERERLLSLSAVNAVRLELPAATTAAATDADFRRAQATFTEWRADGTLARDARPMIYAYEQRYTDMSGASRVARSFFAELRLEPYGPSAGVRPHEHTLSGPREHRFKLLSAVRAHLSPVLLMYDDGAGGTLAAARLAELTSDPATVEAIGPGGVGQRLWAIDPWDSAAARDLLTLLAGRPLTIADGHHRYETALRYRDTPGAPESAAFALALLYEANSGELALAPWHRVISGIDEPATALAVAGEIYAGTSRDSAAALIADVGSTDEPGTLGLWTRSGGLLLRVERDRLEPYVRGLASPEVRWLDVSVLSGTLSRMTGSSESELTASGRLSYTHDAHEATAAVDGGEADAAFILRPSTPGQVLDVAGAGDFMPPKSTYFYPKAATGLVFDALTE
jgi:uncharacterized protein (DUF1015 family)